MCLERSVNRRCGWASTAWALGGKTPARAEVSGAAVASATSCPLHPPSVPTLREQALAETACPTPHPHPLVLISGPSPTSDLGSNPALDADGLCASDSPAEKRTR